MLLRALASDIIFSWQSLWLGCLL